MVSVLAVPSKCEDSVFADKEINELLNFGWSKESTCPVTGSKVY
jgi:hypothetical protein